MFILTSFAIILYNSSLVMDNRSLSVLSITRMMNCNIQNIQHNKYKFTFTNIIILSILKSYYSLYIHKVRWLESVLDKVTVTAICLGNIFSIVDGLWERFNTRKQLSVFIIHLYNDMTWKKTAPVFTHSHLQQFYFGLVKFHFNDQIVLWKIYAKTV